MIDYRILGPLEVSADGRLIEIGGPKLRALLVILLLRANESVPRDVLVHELWGDEPPIGAQHSLDVYVSRLRKSLNAAAAGPVVVTRPGAYSLLLIEDQVDARRFEALVGQGRAALAANAPGQAAEKLRAGLELWRGQALADLVNGYGPRVEAVRLEELRLNATEDRIDSDLALGRHADVAGELEALIAVHPLRERLHGQLMIALYRSGRQAEALEAYQAARRTLVEELGLEPGPALRQLEGAILRQDASLDPPGTAVTGARPVPVRGSRQTWLLGPKGLSAVAAALAVAIALLVAVTSRGAAQLAAGPNTVGVIDGGQARLSAVVTGVGRPNGVAYGAGAVWVTDSAGNKVLQVDPAGHVIDRIPVGRGPAGVTVGGGEVWVANELDGTVSEINPGAGQQVATIPVGIGPNADHIRLRIGLGRQRDRRLAVQDRRRHRQLDCDHFSRRVLRQRLPPAPEQSGSPASRPVNCCASIRPVTASRGSFRSARARTAWPSARAASGSLTAAALLRASIRGPARCGRSSGRRARPESHTPTAQSGSPAAPSGAVSRIDPGSGATSLVRLGNQPTGLAAAGGDVWATVLPSRTAHRGGTLTVIAQQAPAGHPGLETDPAVAWYISTWQMLSMTNDGLVGYRRVGGLAGDQLVPDLARSLPRPTDGGRTYTFRLRAGLRYSTGELVRPYDFRRAIERDFAVAGQQNPGILLTTPASLAPGGASGGPAPATWPTGSSPTTRPARSPFTSRRLTTSFSTSWRSPGPTRFLPARPTA